MSETSSALSLAMVEFIGSRECDLKELCLLSVSFAKRGEYALAIRAVRKICFSSTVSLSPLNMKMLLSAIWEIIQDTVGMRRTRYEHARKGFQNYLSNRNYKSIPVRLSDVCIEEIFLLTEEEAISRLWNYVEALISGTREITAHSLIALEKELRYKPIMI